MSDRHHASAVVEQPQEHPPVGTLDFTSLYPESIMSFNLRPVAPGAFDRIGSDSLVQSIFPFLDPLSHKRLQSTNVRMRGIGTRAWTWQHDVAAKLWGMKVGRCDWVALERDARRWFPDKADERRLKILALIDMERHDWDKTRPAAATLQQLRAVPVTIAHQDVEAYISVQLAVKIRSWQVEVLIEYHFGAGRARQMAFRFQTLCHLGHAGAVYCRAWWGKKHVGWDRGLPTGHYFGWFPPMLYYDEVYYKDDSRLSFAAEQGHAASLQDLQKPDRAQEKKDRQRRLNLE